MNKRPPIGPLRFFRWFCHPEYVEDIEGDLLERFEKKYSSRRFAGWLFTWDILRLFRPGIIRNLGGTKKLNYYGMFKHNFRIAWRSMLRKKTFSFINILGLSTAASVSLLTFLFYQYETSFDGHHKNAQNIYRVVQETQRPDQTLYWGTTAYPLAAALRSDFPHFAMVSQAAGPMNRLFSYTRPNGKKVLFEEPHVLFADHYYPQLFDFEWIVGHPQSALKEPNAVVITEKIARKCFGKDYEPADAVGEVLKLNSTDVLVVAGIIKDNKPNINLKANMLVSYEFFKANNTYQASNWSGNYQGTTFVLLQDHAQKASLQNQINEWKGKYLNADDDKVIQYGLQPLREIHTEPKYGSTPQGYQIPLRTLNLSLLAASFILLIAIINFINLVTANASVRSREVGIRKVIGGGRSAILGQFITENTLLVSIAFCLAIGFSYLILQPLNEFLSIIQLKLSIGPVDILKALAFCLLIALLATIYPSAILSSFQPIMALAKKGTGTSKGGGVRKGLTLIQFALVQVFVIAAIVVGFQLRHFDSKSLGFQSDKVVAIPVPTFEGKDLLVNRLLSMSDVSQVSVGSGPPMSVNNFALGTRFREPQEEVNAGRSAEMKIIDPDYLTLYNIPLIAGRNIRENKERFDEFIVTRSLATSLHWSPEEAIGKQLAINEGEATIVGVVEDFHNQSLQYELTPVVLMNWQAFQWEAFVKVTSFSTLIDIEQEWRAQFPESIFSYHFVDDSMANEYLVENLIFSGFQFLSILVIIIACLGLFGLVSFITLQKTKEIGIRKVLGASIAEIIVLFNRQFSLLILLAFVVATPLVWLAMDRWLATFEYRIALSPWMFVLGGVITFLLGSSIAILKSYRTATLNPAETLKDE